MRRNHVFTIIRTHGEHTGNNHARSRTVACLVLYGFTNGSVPFLRQHGGSFEFNFFCNARHSSLGHLVLVSSGICSCGILWKLGYFVISSCFHATILKCPSGVTSAKIHALSHILLAFVAVTRKIFHGERVNPIQGGASLKKSQK